MTTVIGESPGAPGFFWLAALGGYGIQVAPAAGRLAAELATGARPADGCQALGVDPKMERWPLQYGWWLTRREGLLRKLGLRK